MKRALIIGMTKNRGGIESYILNTFKHIDKNQIKFDFVSMCDELIASQKYLEDSGCSIYHIPSEYIHPRQCFKVLKKILLENKYDIVHINKNSLCSNVILKATKDAKVPVRIIHAHNTRSTGGIIGNVLHNINKKNVQKYCNYYFACTQDAGQWMFDKNILLSPNYYVINNAIDLKKFLFNKKTRENKRKDLKIKDSSFVIGNVGRFEKQKNHDFIISIFNEVKKVRKDSVLVLVGTGSMEKEIKKIVNNIGLTSSVIFLGARDDVNELYQAFDIFLLPSLYEGLPVVGIEAQTADLPCVFSNNMTKKTKILDSASFISLDAGTEKWINAILKDNGDRKDNFIIMKENNYDIVEETIKLQNIYFTLMSLENNNE